MMKPVFNLLIEPWIPVQWPDGKVEKLGILGAIKNAHKLTCIIDASVMAEYSLYRFLSLLLEDALRPKDTVALEELLEEKRFSPEAIDSYVALCCAEGVTFDLLDGRRPFLQTPHFEKWDKTIKPVTALDYTLPSGNNHTHFDHRSAEDYTIAFDEAARLLLSAQLFCTAGVQGYPSNVSASPPYYTVVKGKNLFETLVYSLTPLSKINIVFDNPPVFWRNTEPVEPKKIVAQTSWLFGMFFPARRISLIPEENGISHVYLCQGLNYQAKESWKDPYVTYRMLKDGRSPWRPNAEKAIWRNLNDLVDFQNNCAPQVLRQYFDLEKESNEASISLYGVQTSQASYLGVFHFDLTIPVQLTADEVHVACISRCIQSGEAIARALKHSLNGIPEVPESVISQAVQDYYDCCETEFWKMCRTSLRQEHAEIPKILDEWKHFLGVAVRKVHRNTTMQLHLNARAMGKLAAQEKEIFITLSKI